MRYLMLVGLCGCTTAWYSAYQRQKESAEALRPSAPAESSTPQGPRRVVHVRIFADDAYRAQNGDWQRQIERQVERASTWLGPYGVELVAEPPRVWAHTTAPSLEEDL